MRTKKISNTFKETEKCVFAENREAKKMLKSHRIWKGLGIVWFLIIDHSHEFNDVTLKCRIKPFKSICWDNFCHKNVEQPVLIDPGIRIIEPLMPGNVNDSHDNIYDAIKNV